MLPNTDGENGRVANYSTMCRQRILCEPEVDARLTRILLLNQAVNSGALCNSSDSTARSMLFQARGGNIKIRVTKLFHAFSRTARH
jgi:hypothetical protein